MATLFVRNVPEDLVGRIRELAKEEGRSVNSQVVRMLAEAIESRIPRAAVRDLVAAARLMRESIKRPRSMPASVDLIREARRGRDR